MLNSIIVVDARPRGSPGPQPFRVEGFRCACLHSFQRALKPLGDQLTPLVHAHPAIGPVGGHTAFVYVPRMTAGASHSLGKAAAHGCTYCAYTRGISEDRVANGEEVSGHAGTVEQKTCDCKDYFRAIVTFIFIKI